MLELQKTRLTSQAYAEEWFRNYSEIEHFLTSDLRHSQRGIESLLLRITLFTHEKQHIPYLLLIHQIFYDPNQGEDYKRKNINNLIADLHQNIIKKEGRNPLFDFMPPYYVILLISDLRMNGYNIDPLIWKLSPKPGENPVLTLQLFGDYSAKGFPENLLYLFKHLTGGKIGEGIISKMAISAVLSNNLRGFDHLIREIKNDEYQILPLIYAAVRYIDRGEVSSALKIGETLKQVEDQCAFYLRVSKALADNKNISVLNDLNLSHERPEITISIMIGLISYYMSSGENPDTVSRIFDEANQKLLLIEDEYIRSLQTIEIMDLSLKLGKHETFGSLFNGLIFRLKQDYSEDSLVTLKIHLLQVLVNNDQKDKALEMNELLESDSNNKVLNIEISILQMLRRIDDNMSRQDILFNKPGTDVYNANYKPVFTALDLLNKYLPATAQQSHYFVCQNMAKNEFYNQAIEFRYSMEEDFNTRRIDANIPLYAVSNGNIDEAKRFLKNIEDYRTRLDIMLCLTPYLEKAHRHEEAFEKIRNWAVNTFETA